MILNDKIIIFMLIMFENIIIILSIVAAWFHIALYPVLQRCTSVLFPHETVNVIIPIHFLAWVDGCLTF